MSPNVNIAFKEGFQNDTVVVRLNQTEVYQRDELKTRMQIGLADDFEWTAPAGAAELAVEIPTRRAAKTLSFQVPPQGMVYIGVSIASDGTIHCEVSNEPFRYA
jgi:hypothetical protein